MKFKIATPERIMLETEVDSITLPTTLGEITILENHIPLVANLAPGEIKYKSENRENFFVVSSGVIEVKKNNQIVVLAESAEFGHEIDVERAEAARVAAKQLMSESYKDDKSYADASAGVQKHLVRLKVAHKHRTRKQPHVEN